MLLMLEKTLESPLDSKKIKPVNPKGNQPWLFIGRTDDEAEAPILWPPDMKSQLLGKDPDAGKDWEQEETRETDGEMVGWHHQLSGQEFEQTLGDSERQGSLACSSWGCKELDTTEQLNNKLVHISYPGCGKPAFPYWMTSLVKGSGSNISILWVPILGAWDPVSVK